MRCYDPRVKQFVNTNNPALVKWQLFFNAWNIPIGEVNWERVGKEADDHDGLVRLCEEVEDGKNAPGEKTPTGPG